MAGTIVVAAVAAITAAGISPASAETNGGTRVMPLGDSITEGTQVPGGYRIGLWQRVSSSGYRVDLVGSQFNGPASLGDHDHEGHPGWRIDQIDANIGGWLGSQNPRTVLLHIGTNDVLQNYNVSSAPSRLSTLVDHITAAVPAADVFVAQIIPLANAGQENAVRTFNAAIPGIVQAKVAAGKHVHLVDLHSALTAADLTDGIHPTATGYDKMAATWYAALQGVPGSIGSTGTTPAPGPSVDPAAWYTVVNRNSGKALDICSASTADGACVQQYTRSGGTNQQFQFVSSGGGYYRVKARHSGKVLDDYNFATANSSPVKQWTDLNGTNQQWSLLDSGGGYVRILNRTSAKVLDVANSSTADGAAIIQYTDHNGNNQQWQLVRVG